VRCEGWRVVAREARRGATDGADRVAVVGGINNDDAVGVLKRFEESESAGASIEAFNVCGEWFLFDGADYVDANALIAHEDVA